MKVKQIREVEASFRRITLEDFISTILPVTVRDDTLNREGVWSHAQRKGYLSTCMVGYGNKTLIQLVDLKALYKLVTEDVSNSDPIFAKYINDTFLANGYLYAHLDGGNRCDTFEFACSINSNVKIEKAEYKFLPEDDDGYQYIVYVDKDRTLEEVKKDYPKLYNKFMKQELFLWIYSDLTQEERAIFFDILNAGVSINAQEHRNPTVSVISNGTRRLAKEYMELFISAGVLTEADAKRYGFQEFILKLNHSWLLARNGSLLPYLGSKKDLDSDYKTNSALDTNFPAFEKFFVTQLVPYVKLMNNKKKRLFKKNSWNDFTFLLTYMAANDMKLPDINNAGRYALISEYNEWLVKKCADKKTIYKKIKSTYQGFFSDLFSKNANKVIKIRTTELREQFIPIVLKKKIIVRTDEQRNYDDQERAEIYSNTLRSN